ncbi:MAG: hypothetical protein ACOYOJ_16960 [Alsobacter sp.]
MTAAAPMVGPVDHAVANPADAGPVETDRAAAADAPGLGRAGLALAGAAVGCALVAGLLLWWARGAAVFTDMAAAAIAWCF